MRARGYYKARRCSYNRRTRRRRCYYVWRKRRSYKKRKSTRRPSRRTSRKRDPKKWQQICSEYKGRRRCRWVRRSKDYYYK